MEGNNTQQVDDILKLHSLDDESTLRSRIQEQSGLICILKQRSDQLMIRVQSLQRINSELEDQLTSRHSETDQEKRKRETLERRFMDLAANNQAIISFMEEHKGQNERLKLENKRLQTENQTLFSQKLQDKETLVQNLKQEVKVLTETRDNKENQYREKLTEYESKLLEQEREHGEKERKLCEELDAAQRQSKAAAATCRELKMLLQKTEGEKAEKETKLKKNIRSLNEEKEKLLNVSVERGKVIQEKQEEIHQLEKKWKEERKTRIKAEERFKLESESVDIDVKVKSLKSSLDESRIKYDKLNQDFAAFRLHSSDLLTQERDLNKKLRHMIG